MFRPGNCRGEAGAAADGVDAGAPTKPNRGVGVGVAVEAMGASVSSRAVEVAFFFLAAPAAGVAPCCPVAFVLLLRGVPVEVFLPAAVTPLLLLLVRGRVGAGAPIVDGAAFATLFVFERFAAVGDGPPLSGRYAVPPPPPLVAVVFGTEDGFVLGARRRLPVRWEAVTVLAFLTVVLLPVLLLTLVLLALLRRGAAPRTEVGFIVVAPPPTPTAALVFFADGFLSLPPLFPLLLLVRAIGVAAAELPLRDEEAAAGPFLFLSIEASLERGEVFDAFLLKGEADGDSCEPAEGERKRSTPFPAPLLLGERDRWDSAALLPSSPPMRPIRRSLLCISSIIGVLRCWRGDGRGEEEVAAAAAAAEGERYCCWLLSLWRPPPTWAVQGESAERTTDEGEDWVMALRADGGDEGDVVIGDRIVGEGAARPLCCCCCCG